jgi:hypothetical protein
MRSPGNYRLGTAILHFMFGVTPRQRIQPVVEGIESITEKGRMPIKTAVAAAGLFAGLAAVLLALRNRS